MNINRSLRGINIGGWLVTEKWITPDLFEGTSGGGELTLYSDLGPLEARKRLQRHRDTFITEKDFKSIKKYGFDAIRLPVGYWSFGLESDYLDSEKYVDLSFAWAKKHDLKIILDFHGLQGSQNGHDHSGRAGKIHLYRYGNTKKALNTLEYIAHKYGHHPSLIGLEIINEPKIPWCRHRLLKYYDQAIEVVSDQLSPEVKVIVSDAFKPLKMAKMLSKRGYKALVVLDVHLYQLFSRQDRRMSYSQHLYKATYDWAELLDDVQQYMPVLVGEWSAALPHTMPHSGNTDEIARRYYHAQYQTFQDGSWANCYWTYKAPGAGIWDYSRSHKLLDI